MNEIAELRGRLATCAEHDRAQLTERLNERSVMLSLILERNRHRR